MPPIEFVVPGQANEVLPETQPNLITANPQLLVVDIPLTALQPFVGDLDYWDNAAHTTQPGYLPEREWRQSGSIVKLPNGKDAMHGRVIVTKNSLLIETRHPTQANATITLRIPDSVLDQGIEALMTFYDMASGIRPIYTRHQQGTIIHTP